MKLIASDTDVIKGVEEWFMAQCDGDWEHSYGFSIESTDNPGWYVEVDLTATSWADRFFPFTRDERSDSDWIQFEIREGKFIGSGSVSNLGEILRNFLLIVKMQS
jgi:hypothetical protein